MSRFAPVLGALRGYEQGQQTLEETKLKIADAMQRLREYKEVTLPSAQAQIQESGARTELYRKQVAGVGLTQKRSQFEYDTAIETYNELKKLENKYGGRIDLEQPFAQARQQIAEAQNKAEEAKKGEEIDLPGARAVTEKAEVTERGLKASTGAEAEEIFAEEGGARLIAEERRVGLKTKKELGPVSVDQAVEELQQARVTTEVMEAEKPFKIASYPLTQQLLQTQVEQAEQNLSVSQTYDMKQAQANLASTQENTARTKREIQRIDTEMKDKAALDGIAVNSGLINPITNKPVTTWEDYKLVMNFKMDEQLAMVRAKSTGGSGLPTMSQNVDRITLRPDATLFGGKIPYKSEETVINFISFIPHFLEAGQNPYAAWALAKMQYVTSEPWDALKRDAAASNDTMSQRFMAGYLPPDMVVSDEQTQRVMDAIQKEVSEQARTSAAGGTPPPGSTTPTGPPTGIAPGATKRPPREQVSITESQDTTFGLDAATRQRIAGIIDFHRNASDLQERLIKEIAKEKDMNKRNQMGLFAEHYFETKR